MADNTHVVGLRIKMNTIKKIKLSKHNFIIQCENFSINLSCKIEQNKYIVDISSMNLIDALKTSIMCSTYCFIKDFKKKICWIVADEEIKRAISILRLSNVEQIIKPKEERIIIAS